MTKHKHDYPFGVNKQFNGSDEEWNRLKQTVVCYDRNTSSHPHIISVICPHCGSHNHHNVTGGGGHRACDSFLYNHDIFYYDCPGYVLSPAH